MTRGDEAPRADSKRRRGLELPLLLSASLPDELCQSPRAADLGHFIGTFLRGLLAADGRLVFGGHPTVTPLVQRVARDFGEKRVELYQLAKYREEAGPEVYEPEFVLHWVESDDLAPMREAMAEQARAAVFIGGRKAKNIGGIPGIRDEYRRFLDHHPDGPVYVLGLLDGEAGRLIEEMGDRPEPNRLEPREQEALHRTTNVDLAASLILADLRRYVGEEMSRYL